MLTVSLWTLLSLMLLVVMPDRWQARHELAKAYGWSPKKN